MSIKELEELSNDYQKEIDSYGPLKNVLLVGAGLILMNNAAANTTNTSKRDLNRSKLNFKRNCSQNSIEEYIKESIEIDRESTLLIDTFPSIDKDLRNHIIESILSFKTLENSWNGFGAIPSEIKSVANSILLIYSLGNENLEKISDFYPNPHGTVSLVFENESDEIVEVEIGNTKYSFYYNFRGAETKYFNNINANDFTNSLLLKAISAL